jgi:hypothetical protein
LHPQQSSEVSPFITGRSAQISLSREFETQASKLPFQILRYPIWRYGFSSFRMRPWARLNVSASLTFATSQPRDLATSRPCWLNRRVFTLLVHEVPRCAIPPYTLPHVHKNLSSSALRDSTPTRVSAPRHFATRESLVPPVFHSHPSMAHTAPAVRISLSHDLAISASKFLDLFLRGPETRSLAQIQRSSCNLNPTAIIFSPLAYSRLGVPNVRTPNL